MTLIQSYQINLSSLTPFVSGVVTGLASIGNYFGYSGISVSGAGTWNINLAGNQAVLTTRVNISSGAYSSNFIIGNSNAFPGAITRFNFQLPSGTGINIQVSGYNGLVINQAGLSENGQTYMEWSYDGTKWNIDQWA